MKGVWICQHVRPLQALPYATLVAVLVYSIFKVKSLFKQSYVQLNPNLKLLWFFILLLISYVFQYLIAYPLHVIHDEEESESSKAFAR